MRRKRWVELPHRGFFAAEDVLEVEDFGSRSMRPPPATLAARPFASVGMTLSLPVARIPTAHPSGNVQPLRTFSIAQPLRLLRRKRLSSLDSGARLDYISLGDNPDAEEIFNHVRYCWCSHKGNSDV